MILVNFLNTVETPVAKIPFTSLALGQLLIQPEIITGDRKSMLSGTEEG